MLYKLRNEDRIGSYTAKPFSSWYINEGTKRKYESSSLQENIGFSSIHRFELSSYSISYR